MNIILLAVLENLVRDFSAAVDHAAMHRNRVCQDSLQQAWTLCVPQRVYATFGQCKVDRLREVQWRRGRITEV